MQDPRSEVTTALDGRSLTEVARGGAGGAVDDGEVGAEDGGAARAGVDSSAPRCTRRLAGQAPARSPPPCVMCLVSGDLSVFR